MSEGDKSDTSILPIEKILLPVDRTSLSTKAANYGIHLAEVEKAKILILMHIEQGGAIRPTSKIWRY
jgi:nucleotide-binding universal stress UspA family protein